MNLSFKKGRGNILPKNRNDFFDIHMIGAVLVFYLKGVK
jgi:hypothetical protein